MMWEFHLYRGPWLQNIEKHFKLNNFLYRRTSQNIWYTTAQSEYLHGLLLGTLDLYTNSILQIQCLINFFGSSVLVFFFLSKGSTFLNINDWNIGGYRKSKRAIVELTLEP